MRESNSGNLNFILEFQKKQAIWDKIFGKTKETTKALLNDLKKICKNHIADMDFSSFTYIPDIDISSFADTEELDDFTYVYHYHKKALNKNWQRGYDISPLLIATDAHHGRRFVDFLFNSECYRKSETGTVSLLAEWKSKIFNLAQEIEEDD